MQTLTRRRDHAPTPEHLNDELAPAPAQPPRRRRLRLWAVVAGAVLLGAGGGLATVLVVQARDTSEREAVDIVAATHTDVERVARRFSSADRLIDVQVAARSAADAADRAREEVRSASQIHNQRKRVATREAAAADLAVLDSLAPLADVTPERLSGWDDRRQSIDGARAAIDRAAGPLEELRLEHSPPSPASSVAAARLHLDELMTAAERRYGRWRRRFRAARKERDADLAVIVGYAGSMRGHLSTYSSLRTELSNWMGKVDSQGVTFGQAYDFLAEASAARSRVRVAIAALDPPSPVAAQHNDLLSTIDQAVRTVDSAYNGTIDFQFDFAGDYAYYREAPGWDSFKSESERISTRYSAAQGAWESKLASARTAVKDRRLPKEPQL
jgi:hypothetical protein